jgi:hypothetical protein
MSSIIRDNQSSGSSCLRCLLAGRLESTYRLARVHCGRNPGKSPEEPRRAVPLWVRATMVAAPIVATIKMDLAAILEIRRILDEAGRVGNMGDWGISTARIESKDLSTESREASSPQNRI